MKKLLISILSFILITGLMCSCSGSTPQKTISEFETAVNNYDLQGIVNCYEPKVQDAYSGLLTIGDKLLGISDLEKILNGLGGIASILKTNVPGVMPSVKITVDSIETIEPDKVLATLNVKYISTSDSQDMFSEDSGTEQTVYAYLVKIDGIWYFSSEIPKV